MNAYIVNKRSLYKIVKVTINPYASVDADVCVGRYGCLRRSMRMSASVDADACVGRCGCLYMDKYKA
ncbi:hypothetical protein [Leyella stercorea]|uniref:hypothetical protein n=1 Tax=Leyella stercorea TaxID=363265 RepID=UPI002FE3D9CF